MKTTKYLSISNCIFSGDVVLFKGTGLIARIIRWFSDDFSHAALVVRLDEFQGLKDRRFVVEAVGSGVVLSLLSNAIDKHGDAYLLRLCDRFNDKRDGITSWALERVGTPYDFGGVLRNLFGRISSDINRLWCSELIYYADKSVGFPVGEKAWRPGDILKTTFYKPPIKLE